MDQTSMTYHEQTDIDNTLRLREILKTLPAKMNYLRSIYKDRDQRLNWAKKKLVKYLRSKGEKVPTGITFTRVVNLITGEE